MKLNDLKLIIKEVIEEAKQNDVDVDITKIEPEQKDIERAEKITDINKASKQANAITDKVKLIRRLKAVLNIQGEELAKPFFNKAKDFYSEDELSKIKPAKSKIALSTDDITYVIKPEHTGKSYILPVGRCDMETGDNDKNFGFSFNIYRDWGDDCYAELWGTFTNNPFDKDFKTKGLGKAKVTRIIATSYENKKLKKNDDSRNLPIDEMEKDNNGNTIVEIYMSDFYHDQTLASMNGKSDIFYIKTIKMKECKTDPLTAGKKLNCSTYK